MITVFLIGVFFGFIPAYLLTEANRQRSKTWYSNKCKKKTKKYHKKGR